MVLVDLVSLIPGPLPESPPPEDEPEGYTVTVDRDGPEALSDAELALGPFPAPPPPED